MEMINATKHWLSSTIEIKDIGDASYVVDVKIVRNCSKKLLGMW